MRTLGTLVLFLALGLTACGGGGEEGSAPAAPSTSASAEAPPATTTPTATTEVLGEASLFSLDTGGAGELAGTVEGRECGLADPLFGSCRASTGAGGEFFVTAESTLESPTDFAVVVRCGTDPSLPVATASGDFQPVTADLGLAPYGEVVGVTFLGATTEAALVYQPEDAECPVVWSLGEVGENSIFTGGIDALNGSEAPIAFTGSDGKQTCASADESGGITVGACPRP